MPTDIRPIRSTSLSWTAVALGLIASCFTLGVPATPARASTADPAQVASGIFEHTNAFRQQQGREKLKHDARLTKAASAFAAYMARTGKYGHGADGRTPAQRAEAQGYKYCTIAENIAFQYSSAGFTTEALTADFMKGWRHSPEHRRNMLLTDITEFGVGVAHSADTGRYYAVQLFGRPESLRRSFKITNGAGVTVDYRLGDQTFSLPPRYTRTHRTCRDGTLHIQWPGGRKGTSVEPEDGDHFRIERGDGGTLRLEGG